MTDIIYAHDVVENLSDDELYQRLYKSWNITNNKIEVWGELRINDNHSWAGIYDVKTIAENHEISYPLEVEKNIDSGIFFSLEKAKLLLGSNSGVYIRCQLRLAWKEERKKQENPFLLEVDASTARLLKEIPHLDKNDIIDGGVKNYIKESIYDLALNGITEQINKKQAILDKEHHQNTLKIVDERELIESLIEQKTSLGVSNSLLKSSINIQKEELTTLNYQHEKVEQEMSEKIKKLKSYITERAQFLKDFEFIDEEEFDGFINNNSKVADIKGSISFKEELNGEYDKAVSYIQAYLKEQNSFYPRHIIENYLTLIRSHDLIILAGDSGSGKTNLVQSFAKSVGGVSKIIPVKPNWTSSEDLLGYYNPLEKKYLATSFLEAIIEAQQHPDVPYFICLDEMNLARVEYYFADFLSKLETRDATPEIQLYSDDESAHILSELKAVVSIISDAKDKYSRNGIIDFVKLMQDEEINAEMKRTFGFGEKDSLIKYHGDIRRMLSGIMNTPSTIKIPNNIRIIGTVNIDETTHYLSPKILDRAHIMKFKSPLLTDWDIISDEIKNYGFNNVDRPIHFEIADLGERTQYPPFDREDDFCKKFVELNKEFFDPLGIDFGMRPIRQGLNYLELFGDVDVNDNYLQAMNNFILHKVLPKLTFDGNKQLGDNNKLELLNVLCSNLSKMIPNHEKFANEFSSIHALKKIIDNAKNNDGIVNYWA